jgi:hypothetical protein
MEAIGSSLSIAPAGIVVVMRVPVADMPFASRDSGCRVQNYSDRRSDAGSARIARLAVGRAAAVAMARSRASTPA